MDNLWFKKITITQIQYINVQQILVITFEFTGTARGFMIMSCAARGVKKIGQHWFRLIDVSSGECIVVQKSILIPGFVRFVTAEYRVADTRPMILG